MPFSIGTPVLLGLLAAATWGAADFAGGLATRRAAPSRVVLIAHGVSFLLLGVICLRMHVSLPIWAMLLALLSGVVGGAGLMLFYEALALGVMGLAAALAGLLTAVLPVVLGIYSQGAPAPAQLAGFVIAAVAIVLIAYAPSGPGAATSGRALGFSMVAGVCFGLQLVWLHSASAAHSLLNASTSATTTSLLAPVLLALLLSRLGGCAVAGGAMLVARGRPSGRLLPTATTPAEGSRVPMALLAVTAGLLDAAGNGFYMLSSLGGRLDVAAVLSSLYPGGTILLAALLLKERTTRLQALGMGLALVAVALIAA